MAICNLNTEFGSLVNLNICKAKFFFPTKLEITIKENLVSIILDNDLFLGQLLNHCI